MNRWESIKRCLHRKKLSNNLQYYRVHSATTYLLAMSDSELVLHVWPSGWDLPSINAECLAVIIYAQLAIPGEFVVEECTDPDLSPNGAQRCLNFSKNCPLNNLHRTVAISNSWAIVHSVLPLDHKVHLRTAPTC